VLSVPQPAPFHRCRNHKGRREAEADPEHIIGLDMSGLCTSVRGVHELGELVDYLHLRVVISQVRRNKQ
jgi:hypothetical protein